MNQKGLAEWATREFGLDFTVSQGTVSNILRDAPKILSLSVDNLTGKRRKKFSNDTLDVALGLWVSDVNRSLRDPNNQLQFPKLTDKLLVAKAKEFAEEIRRIDEYAVFPEFSTGWLSSFKRRHAIRFSTSFSTRKSDPMAEYEEDVEVSQRHEAVPSNSLAFLSSVSAREEASSSALALDDSGRVKSNEEYIALASTERSRDEFLTRLNQMLNGSPEEADPSALSTSVREKLDVLRQAVAILQEFSIPTSEIKTAMSLIIRQESDEI